MKLNKFHIIMKWWCFLPRYFGSKLNIIQLAKSILDDKLILLVFSALDFAFL